MFGVVVMGLTGSIGSGKSAVAELFAEKGAIVIDADDLARQAVEPGAPAYAAVVDRFGAEVLGPDGGIDRAALASLVFEDAGSLADLNAVVHPTVADAMRRRLSEEDAPGRVVVAVVPLLVEVAWEGADVVIVVDCPEELAVERLVAGRGMAEADARRRLAAQAGRAERRARADRVIVNDGSWENLRDQVNATWEWMRTIPPPFWAGSAPPGGR